MLSSSWWTGLIWLSPTLLIGLAGCGLVSNEDVFDPEVLDAIVQDQVNSGLQGAELADAVQRAVVGQYGTIVASDQNWILNEDDGAKGQVSVLYSSAWEYLLLVRFNLVPVEWNVGSPDVEIWDFVLDGKLLVYADGGTVQTTSYAPGEAVIQPRLAVGAVPDTYRVEQQGTWLLEYGRGIIPNSLYDAALPDQNAVAAGLLFSELPVSIANEFIRNLVNKALGVETYSFGGFGT